MMRIRILVAAVALAAVLSAMALPAVILITHGVAIARDPVSPLFSARLEATLAGWEMAALPADCWDEEVLTWPASAQPASLCVGSICVGSLCLGSLCVSSDCVGSGCVNSGCVGSSCVGSVCLGSGCAGSLCGGSACMGTTLCIRMCGGDTSPPIPQDPMGSMPSSSPMNCPEN